MKTSIYFAPLQSYTILPYCLAFNSQVGGVDKYFTPFYRAEKSGKFLLEHFLHWRQEIEIVPQILTNNPAELFLFANDMIERGFKEINLNLGCPFPLVVNRKMGSGLLPHPVDLERILSSFFKADMPLKLSVKLRLGLSEINESIPVIEVLKGFPIGEVIMHPRLGIQKYKGTPDWNSFGKFNKELAMVGNGDIATKEELYNLACRFTGVKAWMIGRGLLVNPCMLKPELDWKVVVCNVHDEYLNNLYEFGFSNQQVINQLKCFWEYPSKYLEGGQRVYRKMKKASSIDSYTEFKNKLLELNQFKT